MTPTTAGRLLARVLSVGGIGAAYGLPLPGLPVTEVPDTATARLLAAAHRAVHGVPAVAHLGDGLVVVDGPHGPVPLPAGGPLPSGGPTAAGGAVPSGGPTAAGGAVPVADPAALLGLAPVVASAVAGPGTVLHVALDPATPVPEGPVAVPAEPDPWPEPGPGTLAAVGAAASVVVLAGPGVVHQGAVGGLRALAAAGRLGVCNTWGAKGVFPWRSRHHWATVGLQELDLELGGLPGADLVLVVGVDERESPRARWSGFPHRRLGPAELAPLAEAWPRPPGPFPAMPPLRERLAAVTQAGWSAGGVPMAPSLVTRHYAEVLGHGGLVAADAGTAGFWVARTFPTVVLGSACVPPAVVPGWAAACATVARLAAPLRPVLAVVDGPLDEATGAVLASASRLGVTVGVEVWSPDGEAAGPDGHLARLRRLADPQHGGTATLATDGGQLGQLVDVAGPVRAWSA